MTSTTRWYAIALASVLLRSGQAAAQSWSLGGITLKLGANQTATLTALRAAYNVKLDSDADERSTTRGWQVISFEGDTIGGLLFKHDALVSIERYSSPKADPWVALRGALEDMKQAAGPSAAFECSIGLLSGSTMIMCGPYSVTWGSRTNGTMLIIFGIADTKRP